MPNHRKENNKTSKSGRRANGDGSIVWREDRQSYTVTLMVNGKRHYRSAGTKQEAKAVLKSMQHEIEAGMQLDRPRFTVASFVTHWLNIKKSTVRGSTYSSYISNMNRLLPYLSTNILLSRNTMALFQLDSSR